MHPRTQELLDHLDKQRAIMCAAFDAVPPDRRDRAPAEGRWSVANAVEHTAIVEGRIAAMINSAIETGLPPEPSTDPIVPTIDDSRVRDRTRRVHAPEVAHPRGLSAAEAWTQLEQAGAMLRHAVMRADGLALGEASMPHPLFGPLSLHHWVVFAGAHEVRHAAQIREIAGELAAR